MNAAPKIIPVILSGGAGTRLWPVSRVLTPKQFQRFGGEATFLQRTLGRCVGDDFDEQPILVGALEQRGLLLDTLQSLQISADVILEPCRRNSCAAVLAGSLRALERDANAIVLVLAADHHIPDNEAFQTAVKCARGAALAGEIVTFGVSPTFAATGYGYILPGTAKLDDAVVKIECFVEKPDAENAERYLQEGYLWNSGNFLFSAKNFAEEVQVLAPAVYDAVFQALGNAQRDSDFIRLSESAFSKSPSVSVDVAIMEKTRRAAVMPVSYVWSDVGTWDAVAATMPVGDNNNSVVGNAAIVDCRNVIIQSDNRITTVVGCDDIIVVTTDEAVLVVRRGASEGVKALTEQLRLKGFEKLL